MKKKLVWIARCLVMALCLVVAFTGCTPFSSQNINDLLRAPALGQGQGEVQKALAAYLGSEPEYKFPKEGDWRSPLLMADLDGDGVDEGILLYSMASKTGAAGSNNVYVAVLKFINNEWQVIQNIEGSATEVASFEVADLLGDGTQQLIVGFATANLNSKTFTLYQYQDGALVELYKKPYSRYELDYFTGRDLLDLVIVSTEETRAGLNLQYVPANNGVFDFSQTVVLLDSNFKSCSGIYASEGQDGQKLLVVDAITTTDMLASQIVQYSGEHFYIIDDSGKVLGESGRLNPLLKARDIDEDDIVEIPLRVGNSEILTVSADKRLEYVEWKDFTGPEAVTKEFGLLDSDRSAYIRLPGSWRTQAGQDKIIVVDGSESGEWVIEDAQTHERLVSLQVYPPGESPATNSIEISPLSNSYLLIHSTVTAADRENIEVTLLQ